MSIEPLDHLPLGHRRGLIWAPEHMYPGGHWLQVACPEVLA